MRAQGNTRYGRPSTGDQAHVAYRRTDWSHSDFDHLHPVLFALFFHNNPTDPNRYIHALKNLAIAGGLLCLFAQSKMRWSYDSMRLHRRAELVERDADERVHDAEL